VLDYFKPQFTLGMTATPDKRDDNMEGKNIYEIFNNQIAYEIRLKDAMEEKLLCTFHYFGITDLSVISDTGKTKEEQVKNFIFLTSDERVENIIANAKLFGFSGDRVKGLIFCSRIDEAQTLSLKFNKRGLRTEVLTGSDSEISRASAIERLAGEDGDDALDYILSVDIFSEGVDVPEINQIIMLRPTHHPLCLFNSSGVVLEKQRIKNTLLYLILSEIIKTIS
jgi:superfamily II DNA or RNA helicase